MSSRISPVKVGQSSDTRVNELLSQAKEGWWNDTQMFGVIARRPELLKAIVPVFESFFAKGTIEPHIFELMRLKTGEVNDCAY